MFSIGTILENGYLRRNIFKDFFNLDIYFRQVCIYSLLCVQVFYYQCRNSFAHSVLILNKLHGMRKENLNNTYA